MRWMWRGFAILSLVLALSGTLWIRGTLPQEDGTITVVGPTAPVEIVRDRHGVPHIYAASEADAYFALGYVHAQDRLWQMEVDRRLGAGRLAELLGKAAGNLDVLMRTYGLYDHAERGLANLDRETRSLLGSYAAGVNSFLDARRGSWLPMYLRLPVEFAIFLLSPEPWRPADSLVRLKVRAWRHGGNWGGEVLRARLVRQLSMDQVAQFLPPYPGDEPVSLPELRELYSSVPLERLGTAVPAPAPGRGSNNWVVNGRHSVTGKPLLANDLHHRLRAPADWYLVHLQTPGLSVIGATLPGVPAVMVGRNERIAWGVANTGPDVQDLYIERLDPGNPERYLAPGGSRPFETRETTIKVRFADDRVIRVRRTRHGPVISDAADKGGEILEAWDVPGGTAVVAMAWTALSDGDLTMQAALRVARARDWPDFVAALRSHHVPQQTFVYADVDGNTGMYAAGRVPIRRPENDLLGLVPAPGWKAAYDWNGFIAFDELPHSFNPPSGMIVAANQKIVAERYPHHITRDWTMPYRARRIGELLAARPEHSVASFARLQADVRSPLAADFLPLLLAPEPAGAAAAAAREKLRSWDGAMDRDRAEPLIFAAWYRELTRLVYADELGPLFEDVWGPKPLMMRNALSREQGWCDDVATEIRESCAERIATALTIALSRLEESYGQDMESWRWGQAHFAHGSHRPFSLVPVLGPLFDIKLPAGGGSYTVNTAVYGFSDEDVPFVQVHGPTLRAIYDLDDLDRSLFMVSTGQSGNVFSRHYRDLAEPWRDVAYIPMTTNRGAIAAAAVGTLRLVPAANPGAE